MLSRTDRKREHTRAFLKRFYACVLFACISIALWLAYSINIFIFTVLSIVIFFGIIILNLFGIRRLIPGIASQRMLTRYGAAFFYLIVVFILISKVAYLANK